MIAPFKRRKRHAPDPFLTIRATVESNCEAPAVVLVSSVAANDGKTMVCSGLATALAKSGSSTATVDGAKMCKKSRAELVRLFTELREQHDFIIIDGSTLAEGALTLAGIADGVLLTVRSCRPVVKADAEAARTLERFGANFFGVVETTAYSRTVALEATEMQSLARDTIAEPLAS